MEIQFKEAFMRPTDQEIIDVADSEEEGVHVSLTELGGQRMKAVDQKKRKVQVTKEVTEDEGEGVDTTGAVASKGEACSEEALPDPVVEEWEEE